jgi:NCAIR mutase (PurE)-related protein
VITRQITSPTDTRVSDPSQQPHPSLDRDHVKRCLIELHPKTLIAQQPDPQIVDRHLMLSEITASSQFGPLDQSQHIDRHRHPDRDPGGQARRARLVPNRQIPMRRQQAYDLFGGTDFGERLEHPELSRRAQPWAVRSTTVINMRAGSDMLKATALGEIAHRGEHSPLTEIAPIAGIGPVTGVSVLVGAQHHQFRPQLVGDPARVRELGAGQAGRVGDGGHRGIGAERPDRAGQHHRGVDPAREGHHQPAQSAQPCQQDRRRRPGAEELRGMHGERSSHVRRRTGSREIVGAVVDSDPHPGHGPVCADSSDDVDTIAHLDLERRQRTAVPEVVFGEGKTAEQTLQLLAAARRGSRGFPVLATRCPEDVLRRANSAFPGDPVAVDPVGRTVIVGALPPARGFVAVITGGTSDLPVAHETIATLQALGARHRLIADVGVAGLHRLFAYLDELSEADCVIAIAGMEGTLPGVITGLIRTPVVGVPTSVGYGVSAFGHVAAATMLASCAPGLSVVNIDNGFGAAAHAVKIVEKVHGGKVHGD